jgi:hypothetical protein
VFPSDRSVTVRIGGPITVQSFSFPYDRVFDALLAVLPTVGFTVDSQDRVGGGITAADGASAESRHGPIPIQIKRAGDHVTVVLVPSGDSADAARGLLSGLSAYLRSEGPSGARAAAVRAAATQAASHPPSRVMARVVIGLVVLSLLVLYLALQK